MRQTRITSYFHSVSSTREDASGATSHGEHERPLVTAAECNPNHFAGESSLPGGVSELSASDRESDGMLPGDGSDNFLNEDDYALLLLGGSGRRGPTLGDELVSAVEAYAARRDRAISKRLRTEADDGYEADNEAEARPRRVLRSRPRPPAPHPSAAETPVSSRPPSPLNFDDVDAVYEGAGRIVILEPDVNAPGHIASLSQILASADRFAARNNQQEAPTRPGSPVDTLFDNLTRVAARSREEEVSSGPVIRESYDDSSDSSLETNEDETRGDAWREFDDEAQLGDSWLEAGEAAGNDAWHDRDEDALIEGASSQTHEASSDSTAAAMRSAALSINPLVNAALTSNPPANARAAALSSNPFVLSSYAPLDLGTAAPDSDSSVATQAEALSGITLIEMPEASERWATLLEGDDCLEMSEGHDESASVSTLNRPSSPDSELSQASTRVGTPDPDGWSFNSGASTRVGSPDLDGRAHPSDEWPIGSDHPAAIADREAQHRAILLAERVRSLHGISRSNLERSRQVVENFRARQRAARRLAGLGSDDADERITQEHVPALPPYAAHHQVRANTLSMRHQVPRALRGLFAEVIGHTLDLMDLMPNGPQLIEDYAAGVQALWPASFQPDPVNLPPHADDAVRMLWLLRSRDTYWNALQQLSFFSCMILMKAPQRARARLFVEQLWLPTTFEGAMDDLRRLNGNGPEAGAFVSERHRFKRHAPDEWVAYFATLDGERRRFVHSYFPPRVRDTRMPEQPPKTDPMHPTPSPLRQILYPVPPPARREVPFRAAGAPVRPQPTPLQLPRSLSHTRRRETDAQTNTSNAAQGSTP